MMPWCHVRRWIWWCCLKLTKFTKKNALMMRLGMHGWCCGDVEIVSLGHDAFKNPFLHMSCLLPSSTSTWIQGLWCWMMCWQVRFWSFSRDLCFNACNSELSWTQRAFREFQKGIRRKATQHNRPPATLRSKPTKRSTDKFRTDESTGWWNTRYVGHPAHFQVEWPPWLTLTRERIVERTKSPTVPAAADFVRRSNSHNANISHGRIDRNRWYKSFLTIYRCTVQFLSGMITHHSLKQPCPAISSPVFLRTKHPSSKGAAQFFIR